MSAGDPGGQFLHKLPSPVLWDFCRIMDGLSDLDWTLFASEVLCDQTAVRLAERRERRTDWVMNQWQNRNGRVGELIDLLERLQLLRPRDVILDWVSRLKPPPPPPPPPPPSTSPPVSCSQFDPPPKVSEAPPTLTMTEGPLPKPAPPPPGLQSLPGPPQLVPSSGGGGGGGVMCWSYEEVHDGTKGFSPSLQVGEGGFGVVYRASLRNIDCAVKRLKQEEDCPLDRTRLEDSFWTEVDKLTKFRHPNIVDLLGFSRGPGSVCLIYSYMENRSLENQLQDRVSLSWSQRVSIVEGASTALRFLHSPPDGHAPLVHGDVKSSNILLDRHLVAKLADFGLARFATCSSPTATTWVGKTATVRGTVAYLPDEYVRDGQLGKAVDVYSFGVVLLEVLTGRRALETDRKSGDRYLKDLVEEVEDSPTGPSPVSWRKHLDRRLLSGGAAEPAGSMDMVDLACKCLDKQRKKRPAMSKVFDRLQDIHNIAMRPSSSPQHHPDLHTPSQAFPRPSRPLDSSVAGLSHQLSKLGPLEDTYQSSSSFCSLTPPHPLHSSSSLSPSCASFAGPCETDESRGFSQYDVPSQSRSNGTRSRSLSPSTRDQHHSPLSGPNEFQSSQPSVPTEDQYHFPDRSGAVVLTGAPTGPGTRGQTTLGATAGHSVGPECPSPAGSLHSSSPGPSVTINPTKQRLLQKTTLYEEGRIHTAELLSSHDLYGGSSSVEVRGPEESDELDYLPAKHH